MPSIKAAETLDFAEFYGAFQDLVDRGRVGKLTSADFAGTTCTLTNPGGFGTAMSVPRLMPGQGVIIATGSIIPDDRLFELETLGQARLSQFKKDKADTFTVASLELVWVNIDF